MGLNDSGPDHKRDGQALSSAWPVRAPPSSGPMEQDEALCSSPLWTLWSEHLSLPAAAWRRGHVRKVTVECAGSFWPVQRRGRSDKLRTILNSTESLPPWPTPSDLRISSGPGVGLSNRTRRRVAGRRNARSGKAANVSAAGSEAGRGALPSAQASLVPPFPPRPPLTWLSAVPSRNC